MPLDDTLRMPKLELDSLLGRARDDEEPVFPLVRRRAPLVEPFGIPSPPKTGILSATVSIVLLVAVVLAPVLLWVLR